MIQWAVIIYIGIPIFALMPPIFSGISHTCFKHFFDIPDTVLLRTRVYVLDPKIFYFLLVFAVSRAN